VKKKSRTKGRDNFRNPKLRSEELEKKRAKKDSKQKKPKHVRASQSPEWKRLEQWYWSIHMKVYLNAGYTKKEIYEMAEHSRDDRANIEQIRNRSRREYDIQKERFKRK
jgi:hypothetical protein